MRFPVVLAVSQLCVAALCAVATAGTVAQHENLVKNMLAAVDDITKELSQIKNGKLVERSETLQSGV